MTYLGKPDPHRANLPYLIRVHEQMLQDPRNVERYSELRAKLLWLHALHKELSA